MAFSQRALVLGAGLVTMAAAQTASAVTIGFEPLEGYVPGSLVPQQGWVFNSYVGTPNGTVEVSTVSPLAGSQSLRYTQTTSGLFADVSKANVVSTPSQGTTTDDLTGSVLLSADANSQAGGQLGLFLSPDAFNGATPIGILLEGANSASGTGNILIIDNTYAQTNTNPFRPVGSYVPNNVYEFVFGVDFDNANYSIAYRNLTAGETAFTPAAGGGPDGSFTFFGGFASEGDGSFSVDTGTFLRGGVGQIDNITLEQAPIPEPTTLGLAMLGLGGLALRRRSQKGT